MLLFWACLLLYLLTITSCNQNRQLEAVVATTLPTTTITPVVVQSPLLVPITAEIPVSTSASIPESLLPTHIEGKELVKYRGYSGYGFEYPDFEVWYDPIIWEFVPDDNRLVYHNEPNCSLILQSGATDAVISPPADITLAGRLWHYQLTFGNRLAYYTHFGNIVYIFDVSLSEKYDETIKSICQQLAEEVLNTFTLVGE